MEKKTQAKSFKAYNAEGAELEALLEGVLKRVKASYVKHEITAPRGTPLYKAQLAKQNEGDFYLNRSGIALECKRDALAEKYGNLFLEIGEIRDANAPARKRSIETVGFPKHATKKPTIFIHQIGAQDSFYVYSAEELLALALQGPTSGLLWKEAADWRAGRMDKLNLGLLFKSFNREPLGTKRAEVFTEATEATLTQAITYTARKMTLDATPLASSPLKKLAKAYGYGASYQEKYGLYEHHMGGLSTGEIWEEM